MYFSHANATRNNASVCCRQPTSWTAQGSLLTVSPEGNEIAGCPVTLKSWVSLSMTLRTGSEADPTCTALAPIAGAGIGKVGRISASCSASAASTSRRSTSRAASSRTVQPSACPETLTASGTIDLSADSQDAPRLNDVVDRLRAYHRALFPHDADSFPPMLRTDCTGTDPGLKSKKSRINRKLRAALHAASKSYEIQGERGHGYGLLLPPDKIHLGPVKSQPATRGTP
jgi:hypothetical protein